METEFSLLLGPPGSVGCAQLLLFVQGNSHPLLSQEWDKPHLTNITRTIIIIMPSLAIGQPGSVSFWKERDFQAKVPQQSVHIVLY